jgi:hypothetical protein
MQRPEDGLDGSLRVHADILADRPTNSLVAPVALETRVGLYLRDDSE